MLLVITLIACIINIIRPYIVLVYIKVFYILDNRHRRKFNDPLGTGIW